MTDEIRKIHIEYKYVISCIDYNMIFIKKNTQDKKFTSWKYLNALDWYEEELVR